MLGAFEIPARHSLVVELVSKEDLAQVIGLNSTGFNLARVLGPSVAALVIARLGVSWTFGLNALSSLAVLLRPAHAYTRAFLAAVPTGAPRR